MSAATLLDDIDLIKDRHSDVNAFSNVSKETNRDKTPSHMISWKLYQEGFKITEIAKQRELTIITIQNHILRCAEEGCTLNWEEFIASEEEKHILGVVEDLQTEKLKTIKEALPEYISYFTIKAVLCKHNLLKDSS